MTLPKIDQPPVALTDQGTGDVRGAYGYGRAAHGSDPEARYGFEPVPPPPATTTEFVDEIAREFQEETPGE